MRYLSVPTIERNSSGQYFLHYIDTTAVIAVSPIINTENRSYHEIGSQIHLVTGIVLETSWSPSYVVAAMKREDGDHE